MQIDIILPYKEQFTADQASAVSISVKNSIEFSKFKKNIKIYGQKVNKPFFKNNFVGIKANRIIHLGKNLSIIKNYIKLNNFKDKCRITEIHNRPYLFNYFIKKKSNNITILYFHNDPLTMKGSKSIAERVKIIREAAGVVFVSKFIKKKFLEGIPGKFQNLYVIPNSLNKNLKLNKKKDKNIIFVGRIVEEKGVSIYLKSVINLAPRYKDWKFILIGSSKAGIKKPRTLFEKKIYKSFRNIGENVEYLGYLKNDLVKKIMEKSSILVVPSIWDEPFAITALEGLSNKMAVISSKVGGLQEVVKNRGILISNINESKLIKHLENLIINKKRLNECQNSSWNNYIYDQHTVSDMQDKIREKILKNTQIIRK